MSRDLQKALKWTMIDAVHSYLSFYNYPQEIVSLVRNLKPDDKLYLHCVNDQSGNVWQLHAGGINRDVYHQFPISLDAEKLRTAHLIALWCMIDELRLQPKSLEEYAKFVIDSILAVDRQHYHRDHFGHYTTKHHYATERLRKIVAQEGRIDVAENIILFIESELISYHRWYLS